MKLPAFPVKNLAVHADLYRIAAAIALAVLLVVVFLLTQPLDQQRQNTLLNDFARLQRDDARLGEGVLQLKFSLSNDYDQVTAIMADMRAVAAELRHGSAARDLRADAKFDRQLQLLDQRLSDQAAALEKFKSQNSVLKNSLIYLPFARDDLLRDLPPGTEVHEQFDALIEKVMLQSTRAAMDGHDAVAADITALQRSLAGQPLRLREKFDHLARHIQMIDQFQQETPMLVSRLTSGSEKGGLTEAYRDYFARQQQRATTYQLFLLAATLLLLAYAIAAFIRLRGNTQKLQLAASVFSHATECISITDSQGAILDVNPAFTKVTGYSRAEVLGRNPRILQSGRQDAEFYTRMWQTIRESGQWQGEIYNRRKDGVVYPEWLSITAVIQNGQVSHYIGSFTDLTQRKQSEVAIHNLAFYDPLTGLPNRRLLTDRCQQALVSSVRTGKRGALLFIDLDHFKTINDTLGHSIGDLLLQQVAARLSSCVRKGDTVARLGGDEFVVMLEDLSENTVTAAEQTESVGENILATLSLPYLLDSHEHRNTPSIGATLFSGKQQSIGELFKQADIAMYQAKQAGRNTLRFFDQDMQNTLTKRIAFEAELQKALENRQFQLYYQIQVDEFNCPIGAEALIRWIHPERGMVSPLEFIAVAEDTGLILPIGHWVLETACAQLKVWQQTAATRDLVLAVNVSARQFLQENFVAEVQVVIRHHAIEPSRLKLELTESMLLDNIEDTIATMNELKTLGVQFSLDDFGTGYSSLQYLKRLPLDQLKIDQSFVRDLVTDSSDRAIVRTIIAMAHSLNLTVIAEGVETEEQRQLLRDNGCTHYQGYLFGKPLPIAQFENLVHETTRSVVEIAWQI